MFVQPLPLLRHTHTGSVCVCVCACMRALIKRPFPCDDCWCFCGADEQSHDSYEIERLHWQGWGGGMMGKFRKTNEFLLITSFVWTVCDLNWQHFSLIVRCFFSVSKNYKNGKIMKTNSMALFLGELLKWGCIRYLFIVRALPTVNGSKHAPCLEKQQEY